MADTGRCWYCGSEDVIDYSDGSHLCQECGMTWGGRKYVQQTYHNNIGHSYSNKGRNSEWDESMQYYREKWGGGRRRVPKRKHSTNNEWDDSMRYYREKWRGARRVPVQSNQRTHPDFVKYGKKWYEAEVYIFDGCAVPAVAYFLIGILVYGTVGIMLYSACTS